MQTQAIWQVVLAEATAMISWWQRNSQHGAAAPDLCDTDRLRPEKGRPAIRSWLKNACLDVLIDGNPNPRGTPNPGFVQLVTRCQ